MKDNSVFKQLEPTIKPKATENINEVIEMVKIMLEKGYADKLSLQFILISPKLRIQLSFPSRFRKTKQGAGVGEVI